MSKIFIVLCFVASGAANDGGACKREMVIVSQREYANWECLEKIESMALEFTPRLKNVRAKLGCLPIEPRA